jgi:hypothetical protein
MELEFIQTNWPFTIVLGLWCLTVGLAVLMVLRMSSLGKRIERLPEATEWDDLNVKLAARRAEWEELEPRVTRGREIAEQLEQDQARRNVLEEEVRELEASRQELEPLGQRVRALEEELTLKQEKSNLLISELDSKTRELSGVNEALVQASVEKESQEESVNVLTRECAALQEDIRTKSSELNYVQSELDQLTNDLQILSAKNTELKKEIEKYELKKCEALEEYEQYLQKYETKRQELRDEYRVLETDLEGKIDCAKSELSKIGNKRAELQGTADAFENQIKHYQTLLETLKAEVTRAGGAVENDDSLKDLWEPYFSKKMPLSGSSENEEKCLQYTIDHLQHAELIFPKRVVHAFHTALKVNDISPLVVLAGISGTGKSLLPRMYAQGMGMNFIGMAVQPRWDSPQDMFGFYNYMEHKYKGTELSRSLVQFERYNRGKWVMPEDWDYAMDDQVLLVLLDEMNLARVEYYFSEFLSKLEVRRDIDPLDENKRLEAEIALDIGHMGDDKNNIRLYPDNNVLFCGTMNEDESTQTLSDKVLDRSCVLRFGRPNQTRNTRHKDNTRGAKNALSYEKWKSWIKISNFKLTGEEENKISDLITKLNIAMELVGRPFGHRVGQAICTYVTNYPEWVDNRIDLALADQIEQRILPKLRGLDIGEHRSAFDRVGDIINDLDDPPLAQAYNNASEQTGSGMAHFAWQGIDRVEG